MENGAIITSLSKNCTKLTGSLACSCWEGTHKTEAAVEVGVFKISINYQYTDTFGIISLREIEKYQYL